MYVHDVRNDAKDVDLLTPEGSLVGPSAYGSLKQSKSTTTNIPNLPNAVNPISGTPHDYAALLAELARERGGAKTLTPEQRRELEAWNNAFPELARERGGVLGAVKFYPNGNA